MAYEVEDGWAIFFRGIDLAEYKDWRSHARLRPDGRGMESGKHLAVNAADAAKWAALFITAGTAPRVLRIAISSDIAKDVFFLGPMIDEIGPAYFATFEQLADAIIKEVTL